MREDSNMRRVEWYFRLRKNLGLSRPAVLYFIEKNFRAKYERRKRRRQLYEVGMRGRNGIRDRHVQPPVNVLLTFSDGGHTVN